MIGERCDRHGCYNDATHEHPSPTFKGLFYCDSCDPQPVSMKPLHPVVRDIVNALMFLKYLLDKHKQTTHSSILKPFVFEEVLRTIGECYREPRAYTISEAAQTIEHFLKRCHDVR